jgi:hypothetical protein
MSANATFPPPHVAMLITSTTSSSDSGGSGTYTSGGFLGGLIGGVLLLCMCMCLCLWLRFFRVPVIVGGGGFQRSFHRRRTVREVIV